MIIKRHRLNVVNNRATITVPAYSKVLGFGWDTHAGAPWVDVLDSDYPHKGEQKFLLYKVGEETDKMTNRPCLGSFETEWNTYYVFEGGMVGV